EPSPLALVLAVSLIDALRTEDGQAVLADLLRRQGWRGLRPPRGAQLRHAAWCTTTPKPSDRPEPDLGSEENAKPELAPRRQLLRAQGGGSPALRTREPTIGCWPHGSVYVSVSPLTPIHMVPLGFENPHSPLVSTATEAVKTFVDGFQV